MVDDAFICLLIEHIELCKSKCLKTLKVVLKPNIKTRAHSQPFGLRLCNFINDKITVVKLKKMIKDSFFVTVPYPLQVKAGAQVVNGPWTGPGRVGYWSHRLLPLPCRSISVWIQLRRQHPATTKQAVVVFTHPWRRRPIRAARKPPTEQHPLKTTRDPRNGRGGDPAAMILVAAAILCRN